jgi:phosphate/sulfate permease
LEGGVLVVLLLATAAAHGANNGAFLFSMLKAGLGGKDRSLAIVMVLGAVTGTIFEGWKMNYVVILGGYIEPERLALAVAITLSAMAAGSILSKPISYSHILTLSLIGVAMVYNVYPSPITVIMLGLAWVGGAFMAGLLAVLLHAAGKSLFSRLDLLTLDAVNRASLYAIGVSMSYSIAANNIGVIGSLMPLAGWPVPHILLSAAWALGFLVFGRGLRDILAERVIRYSPQQGIASGLASSIAMLLFLNLSIPTSLTHYLLSSALISTMGSPHLIGWSTLRGMVAAWILGSLASLLLSYVLTSLLTL